MVKCWGVPGTILSWWGICSVSHLRTILQRTFFHLGPTFDNHGVRTTLESSCFHTFKGSSLAWLRLGSMMDSSSTDGCALSSDTLSWESAFSVSLSSFCKSGCHRLMEGGGLTGLNCLMSDDVHNVLPSTVHSQRRCLLAKHRQWICLKVEAGPQSFHSWPWDEQRGKAFHDRSLDGSSTICQEHWRRNTLSACFHFSIAKAKLMHLLDATWESNTLLQPQLFKLSHPMIVRPHPESRTPYPGLDTRRTSTSPLSGSVMLGDGLGFACFSCTGLLTRSVSVGAVDAKAAKSGSACAKAAPDAWLLCPVEAEGLESDLLRHSLAQCPGRWHLWQRVCFFSSLISTRNDFEITSWALPNCLDFCSLFSSRLLSFQLAAGTSATSDSWKASDVSSLNWWSSNSWFTSENSYSNAVRASSSSGSTSNASSVTKATAFFLGTVHSG